jgi:steroid 5-alpha reductase family enzyme
MKALLDLYLHGALMILVYASICYILALLLKRNDLADTAWGLGYVVIILACLQKHPLNPIAILVSGLVALWAIRLSWYIGTRNKGKQEDFRYAQWRKEWGKHFYWRTYLQVFILQAVFLLIIAAPIFISFNNTSPLSFHWIIYLGIIIWLKGFLLQVIADYQMAGFRRTKLPGQIMNKGLWKYSRHPNYFGEILMWWGLWLIVLPLPFGWLGIISPITITYLLAFVSGLPMLEKKYIGNANYEAYKKKTSALIPWFPAK